MDPKSHSFLYQYLNSNAPTGHEINGQQIWLRYLKPYIHDYFTDSYGTAVGIINPQASYKVVLEAHADEIAWYINYITDKGYMHVIPNGGSDYQIAPSMHAKIHTAKAGTFPAVFGWPAIHTRRAPNSKEIKPNVDTVILDGGFSSKQEVLDKGINIGDIVTFDQDLRDLNNTHWAGRALDNRLGGFTIAQVARRLHENNIKLPIGLYIVNAVQEEVGLRGATMIAHRIRPNVALITDVCHCTDSPLYSKTREGETTTGNGPVLSTAPAVHPNVRKRLLAIAQNKHINFQLAASSRYTGTDTDAFAYSRDGIPSALLSTPVKYMHTTVEMAHKQDIEQLITWMYEFVCSIKDAESFDVKIDL